MQSHGVVSYKKLRSVLVQVYGSRGQAEVYQAQLKMVRRKKGESLTDLAQEIRRLMVLPFPEPIDRTTGMVARDVLIEALEDQDLVIQAQRPTNLDSALQVAQHMEAVMRTVTSRSSKAVRAAAQDTIDLRVAASFKELKVGQEYLLELLQQLIAEQARRARDWPAGSDPRR